MFFGVSIFFLTVISSASAAELVMKSEENAIYSNKEFQVDMYLNTENERINAIEGVVSFPGAMIALKEVRDGDSVINFWVKRPKLPEKETDFDVVFSGVVIGGYKGKSGKLFSLVFKGLNPGGGSIAIEKARAFLNDGKGTAAQLTFKSYSIRVKSAPIEFGAGLPDNSLGSDSEGISAAGAGFVVSDNMPPEPFNPIITRDAKLYSGKYVIVFNAQDKASGIDHYEVREGDGSFERTESPYVLRNQNMNASIIIRAYDKAGNTRDAFYSPSVAQGSAVKPVAASSSNQNQWPLIFAIGAIIAIYLIARLRNNR